jgi:hypothetical protein
MIVFFSHVTSYSYFDYRLCTYLLNLGVKSVLGLRVSVLCGREEKSAKGALHVGVSKITKGLKKVVEGLAELE